MSEPRPYVPAETVHRDFTVRAVVAGILFGAVFGSANAYLGLKVGLTISTSIPLAVMAVGLFRALGRSNILEANITQTGGSAASSIASGLIFTIPALFMWGFHPSIAKIGFLGLLGGMMGILFMIPLRPYLIVKERAELPYPEGTAAAQVLIAADTGGARAKNVFVGLGTGLVYKLAMSFWKLWADSVEIRVPLLKKGVVGLDTMPALLGVGYILGYRISAIMVAGGLLSSLAIIPLIAHFGESLSSPLFPETVKTIAAMSPGEIWSRYVRYVGAGAVAFAGIVTVVRSLPTMYRSLVDGLRGFTREGRASATGAVRTGRDIPMPFVVGGVSLVALVAAISPHVLGEHSTAPTRVLGSALVTLFAFMFVTVSSRIVGLVGVTSNPTSGMTIVTLLGTSLVFYALGWTDDVGKATVLTVGTVVCVAASIAGDISQDLKCGYIIGATPAKQQTVELVGAASAAFAIAAVVYLLGQNPDPNVTTTMYGTADLAAPQATLMKTVIEGVLQANLPWGLVLAGASLSLVATLLGVPALPFAVGIYLPVSSMTPIFAGGCLRVLVERLAKRRGEDPAEHADKGVLLGAGLIAGEGLAGVGIAAYAVATAHRPEGIPLPWGAGVSEAIAIAVFALLAWFLVRTTK